jgi:two-component system, OmpR family, sensor histidine kinase VicK
MTSIEGSEKTQVVCGTSNVLNTEIQFFSNARLKVDTCMDYTRPSLALRIESIRKSFLDAKGRDVKLRYITEITTENIPHCKELMKIVEVRHLDGIKGNFMVSEKEYLAPAVSINTSGIAPQIIYSNLHEIVAQQNYIFDTLWNKSIPAIKRIREIEEGLEPMGTRLLENPDEIFNHLRYVIENASKRLICSSSGGMQMVYDNFFDQYKKILDKHREGKGDGIRCITTIDKDNKDLVKIFLNAGVRIKHLRNLPPMNFVVDDKHFLATIEKMEGGKMMQSLLISNESIYINHYNSIFEELWKNGIDAVQRIRDIEDGTYLADIEVFHSASRAREVYLGLVKEATKEILFIFPFSNAFSRQHKIGAIGLAENAAAQRNVEVRILMPANKLIDKTVENLDYRHKIDIRYIKQMAGVPKATILIVDRKESLVMELRDDSKTTFDEAIGLSTYSNSKAGVLSYVFIFENLWKQIELYEDIKKSHEQLMILDKMQQQFINVAAHELRTPIQPILSVTQILRSRINDGQQQELLDIVIRNAKRLDRLSDEILDVTKLESQTFELKKEEFNLNDIILNAMDDIVLSKEFSNKNVQLLYERRDILLQADKSRIAEVISNLLSNAIKFTLEGTITISVETDKTNKNDEKNWVIVNVKDTGQGIDASMLSKLFTKFASKSHLGTGLGLFISKGIVEAHGGKIWGKNNVDGIGATFSFSLPVQTIGNQISDEE